MTDMCQFCRGPKSENDGEEVCPQCLTETVRCEDCQNWTADEDMDGDVCVACREERNDAARLRGGLYRSAP